jgi:hypothetical protein
VWEVKPDYECLGLGHTDVLLSLLPRQYYVIMSCIVYIILVGSRVNASQKGVLKSENFNHKRPTTVLHVSHLLHTDTDPPLILRIGSSSDSLCSNGRLLQGWPKPEAGPRSVRQMAMVSSVDLHSMAANAINLVVRIGLPDARLAWSGK